MSREQPTLDPQQFERVLLSVISHGRARCGSGFGKYPLGILEAVERFRELLPNSDAVNLALQDFKMRLDQ